MGCAQNSSRALLQAFTVSRSSRSEVLPTSRRDRHRSAVRVDARNPDLLASARARRTLGHASDLRDRYPSNPPRNSRARLRRKQQLVVFAAIEHRPPSLPLALQAESEGVNRQGREVDPSAYPRGSAEMRQVGRQAVAHVDTRGRQTSPTELPPRPQSGLRKALRPTPPSIGPPGSREHSLQFSCRPSQGSGHVNSVARPSPTPAERRPPRSRSQNTDICHQERTRGLARIAPGERRSGPLRQRVHAVQKAPKPPPPLCRFQALSGQGQRKKGRHRIASHRGNVAQTSRQRPMPGRLRRMEIPAKVPPLVRHVGRDQDLRPRRSTEHSAIIADAKRDPGAPDPAKPIADLPDQIELASRPALVSHTLSSIAHRIAT